MGGICPSSSTLLFFDRTSLQDGDTLGVSKTVSDTKDSVVNRGKCPRKAMLRDALCRSKMSLDRDGSLEEDPHSLGLAGMEQPALILDVKQGAVILTEGH